MIAKGRGTPSPVCNVLTASESTQKLKSTACFSCISNNHHLTPLLLHQGLHHEASTVPYSSSIQEIGIRGILRTLLTMSPTWSLSEGHCYRYPLEDLPPPSYEQAIARTSLASRKPRRSDTANPQPSSQGIDSNRRIGDDMGVNSRPAEQCATPSPQVNNQPQRSEGLMSDRRAGGIGAGSRVTEG